MLFWGAQSMACNSEGSQSLSNPNSPGWSRTDFPLCIVCPISIFLCVRSSYWGAVFMHISHPEQSAQSWSWPALCHLLPAGFTANLPWRMLHLPPGGLHRGAVLSHFSCCCPENCNHALKWTSGKRQPRMPCTHSASFSTYIQKKKKDVNRAAKPITLD